MGRTHLAVISLPPLPVLINDTLKLEPTPLVWNNSNDETKFNVIHNVRDIQY